MQTQDLQNAASDMEHVVGNRSAELLEELSQAIRELGGKVEQMEALLEDLAPRLTELEVRIEQFERQR